MAIGCGGNNNSKEAENAITAESLGKQIATLSSDEFLGRKPFTAGEEKTVNYLKSEFEKLGLKPGNGDSFFQDVPMVELTPAPIKGITVTSAKGKSDLKFAEEFIASTPLVEKEVKLENSEIVFAGFGIVAPEYNWNDYEGLDVKGKTVLVLVNDPGYDTQDSAFFKGKTMTYYGRWTYKYEEAARQGASGVLIVHETGPAGYPWQVLEHGAGTAKLQLQKESNGQSHCTIEGWVTYDAAKKLFALANKSKEFETLRQSACQRGFKGYPLGLKYSLTIQNSIRTANSKNVIAVLPGTTRKDEYVFYTAHWDHFGVGPTVNGDSIYNGAVDNASGTAGLIEIARAFSKLNVKPSRSVVLLAVTAEEQGLLGSAYYSQNPVYPLSKTVAAINMDALNVVGKMKDVAVIGYGHSDLDDYITTAAKEQGRYIIPDQTPEKGSFFRSDHFNFAKVGVLALYAKGRFDHAEKGKDFAKEKSKEYESQRYHQPSDQYDPATWDLSGMVDDLRLLFKVGFRLSNESTFPQWKNGSEFKAKRDQDMGK
ncbi:M28 family peptidase [bacterium]|nr:M28 family peptidase [bacterium]